MQSRLERSSLPQRRGLTHFFITHAIFFIFFFFVSFPLSYSSIHPPSDLPLVYHGCTAATVIFIRIALISERPVNRLNERHVDIKRDHKVDLCAVPERARVWSRTCFFITPVKTLSHSINVTRRSYILSASVSTHFRWRSTSRVTFCIFFFRYSNYSIQTRRTLAVNPKLFKGSLKIVDIFPWKWRRAGQNGTERQNPPHFQNRWTLLNFIVNKRCCEFQTKDSQF